MSARHLIPLIGEVVAVAGDLPNEVRVGRLQEIGPSGPRVLFADGKVRPAAEWRISEMLPVTTRQNDALHWLTRVGKAGPQAIRRAGFSVRTFERLAELGAIRRESLGVRSVPYFRACL